MTINLSFVPFRIDPAADEATAGTAFLTGFNAFLAANGYPVLPVVGDPIILDVTRMDFDGPFLLANGFWHVNASVATLSNADPTTAFAMQAVLAAQIDAWFGADQTEYPVCPDLAAYTSPLDPHQQWPSDRVNGVVLLDPPPESRQRR
jgi:hypothetical protein